MFAALLRVKLGQLLIALFTYYNYGMESSVKTRTSIRISRTWGGPLQGDVIVWRLVALPAGSASLCAVISGNRSVCCALVAIVLECTPHSHFQTDES